MSVLAAIWGFLSTTAGRVTAAVVGLATVLLVTYLQGRQAGAEAKREQDRRRLKRAYEERRTHEREIRRLPDDALDRELQEQRDYLG